MFSEGELAFNEKIAKGLREAGFKVWMAQEELFIKEPTKEEKNTIYKNDIRALEESDVVVAVLDGIDVECGVAFEIGYAAALGKPIIGLKTDCRTFSNVEDVNLIIEVPMKGVYRSVEEVIEALKKI